uniref:hypothetical protein n=1 Tax=Fulvivirga sp. TaxID=1931237 RepID=UPI00404B430C
MTKPLVILFSIIYSCIGLAQNIPNEPFFGLDKSQASKAQMLSPDIVSDVAWESNGSYSPDGTMFLYSTHFMYSGSTIICMMLKNGQWTDPEIASFSGQYADIDPIFSPDGKRIYFTSRRPINPYGPDNEDTNLWYVDVNENGFGQPEQVSAAINSDENQFYNSITNKGTIYFHSRASDSNNIYKAILTNGIYEVALLDSTINTGHSEADPFISPNEDYLIFASNRPGGYGNHDLYISFHNDGKWSEPINLGETVNSEDNDFAPCMSSGILTFTSNRMIENWKTFEKKNYESLLSKYKSADNQTDNIWYLKLDIDKYKNL